MRSLSVSPGFFQPMQEDNSLEGYWMSLAIVAFANVALLYDESNIKMCQFDPIRGTKYFSSRMNISQASKQVKWKMPKAPLHTAPHIGMHTRPNAHGRRKVHDCSLYSPYIGSSARAEWQTFLPSLCDTTVGLVLCFLPSTKNENEKMAVVESISNSPGN